MIDNHQVKKAKLDILSRLKKEPSCNIRYYQRTWANGTVLEQHVALSKAVEQLNKERKIQITARRPFSTSYEDGSKVRGVSVTATVF